MKNVIRVIDIVLIHLHGFLEMSAMEVDNQPLVDPFLIVNEELHDLIYQHFTGKKVMELSKVCRQWGDEIGFSHTAMGKVKLVYDTMSPEFATKDVTAILTSERRYCNVKLSFLEIPKESLQLQVVQKIAPWVKDLNVWMSLIGDVDLKFPRVEKLLITNCNYKPILDGVTPNKLKTLLIHLDLEVQPVKDFLMKCSKLQELHVISYFAVGVFETEAAFPFKLKTFDYTNYASMMPNVISNFEKFLFSQSSSLQHLVLSYCPIVLVKAALKSLPLLKELKLYSLSTFETLQFSVNPSVEILTLNDDLDFFVGLLKALPNLKTLKLSKIRSNTDVDMIASAAMNLREVTYENKDINVKDYYATLKQTNPKINQNIEWNLCST